MDITYQRAVKIARAAHARQLDKNGQDYIDHPLAVAAALAPLGAHAQIAGVLHDVIEDSEWTADDLLAEGIPHPAVRAVQAVTRDADTGLTYQEWIEELAGREYEAVDLVSTVVLSRGGFDASRPVPLALVVKLADNLHNSLPSRVGPGVYQQRRAQRYARARGVLEAALPQPVVACVREGFPEVAPG